ncbi:hypothetical protein FHS83_002302 [Rhizomicrobium palustre]|uniref:Sulfotransferase domain-containing protein n=1 Tax=Rhizomicrobium palustre TaxID=189966 RepID=A0A846MZ97_9PROT|nr:sulfotransferase domain-containing protein [Rhizomicrobium palustre]NIK88984.1 hypothetical protein [Rhizomicrobium palustre]
MAKITWLASYPKSGNTWVRILLANYRNDSGAAVDINALGDGKGFGRAAFDEYCGFKTSTLGAALVDRLRPEIYRAMARDARDDLIVKMHDNWRCSDRGLAVFPADCTKGVVYILRSVLDVAPSAAVHWGVDNATAVERLCDPNYALGGSRRRLSRSVWQPLSSWSHHVRSWCDESGLSVLVIRYEDLKSDTLESLRRIVAFCGLSSDEQRLTHAVSNSRFERLKEVELTGGFREHSECARGSFFRKGQTGSWRQELPSELVRRLVDVHGDVMTRFGYLDARGEPL